MQPNSQGGGLAGMTAREKSSSMGDMYFIDRIEDGMATVIISDPSTPEGYRQEQRSEMDLPEGATEGDTVYPDGRVEKAGDSAVGQETEGRRQILMQGDPGSDISL